VSIKGGNATPTTLSPRKLSWVSFYVCSLLFQGPERMCPTENWRAAVKMYEKVELTGTPILKSL
jgi:hypothetical protein